MRQRCTLHPTPCTLHPTPYTLHLTPYTLHPKPAPYTLHLTPCTLHPTPYFFFFFTLVTGPRRSLSLNLSHTRVYEPQIRARLGTTAHFRQVVVLNRCLGWRRWWGRGATRRFKKHRRGRYKRWRARFTPCLIHAHHRWNEGDRSRLVFSHARALESVITLKGTPTKNGLTYKLPTPLVR